MILTVEEVRATQPIHEDFYICRPAYERLRASHLELWERYNASEAKLIRQSANLAEALKAKNDALELQTQFSNQANALREQCAKLNTELKTLKPPEPKFKIPQVVMYLGTVGGQVFEAPYCIKYRRFNGLKRTWEYTDSLALPDGFCWKDEKRFRALRPDEVG